MVEEDNAKYKSAAHLIFHSFPARLLDCWFGIKECDADKKIIPVVFSRCVMLSSKVDGMSTARDRMCQNTLFPPRSLSKNIRISCRFISL